jgi:hypothetical protein
MGPDRIISIPQHDIVACNYFVAMVNGSGSYSIPSYASRSTIYLLVNKIVTMVNGDRKLLVTP